MAARGLTIEEIDKLLEVFKNETNGIEPDSDIFEVVAAAIIQGVQGGSNEKSVPKCTKVPNGKLLSDLFRSVM